jgi:hypothetical protein
MVPSAIDEAILAATGARISSGNQSRNAALESGAMEPTVPPASEPSAPASPRVSPPLESSPLEASTLELDRPLASAFIAAQPEATSEGELLLEDSLSPDTAPEAAALVEPPLVTALAAATDMAKSSQFELTASAVDVAQILEVESVPDQDSPGAEARTQTLVQTSPVGGAPDAAQALEEGAAPAPPAAEPILAAKPMSILEGRGGVLKASQTQMSTPIQIDHTQLPRVMKDAVTVPQTVGAPAVTVTVQELDATYQKNIFLNSLEIVYYKLLRAAFTQFLIFPKVTSRATVTVISKNPDHLKVAENVLSNTTISFVVCDVKLNIRAVVEVVDDKQPLSNKDRARDYILKKAGMVIVRFYSGDTPPDVSTLRKLLSD